MVAYSDRILHVIYTLFGKSTRFLFWSCFWKVNDASAHPRRCRATRSSAGWPLGFPRDGPMLTCEENGVKRITILVS